MFIEYAAFIFFFLPLRNQKNGSFLTKSLSYALFSQQAHQILPTPLPLQPLPTRTGSSFPTLCHLHLCKVAKVTISLLPCFFREQLKPSQPVQLDFPHPRIQASIIYWLLVVRSSVPRSFIHSGCWMGSDNSGAINLGPFQDADLNVYSQAQCRPLSLLHFLLRGLVRVAFRCATPQTQYWASDSEPHWNESGHA